MRQMNYLAQELRARRDELVDVWIRRLRRDAALHITRSMSRDQLTDSIPEILDALGDRLDGSKARDGREVRSRQRSAAAAHGLNRWQQAFSLEAISREWAHLQMTLLWALERISLRAPMSEQALRRANTLATRTCGEGISISVECFADLRAKGAEHTVRELEATLEQLQASNRRRTEVVRHAAHDLRGSIGVINNIFHLLAGSPDDAAAGLSGSARRAIASAQGLLTDLLELTRLETEAGACVAIEPLDVGILLRELGEILRMHALQANLFLKLQGPAALTVESDAARLKRIVQNLVLNAIRATREGGVTIRWGINQLNAEQWVLEVSDTGPGIDLSSASPLSEALLRATRLRREREQRTAEAEGLQPVRAPVSAAVPPGDRQKPQGEGLGLAIVKELCDSLEGGIEIVTSSEGTTFKMLFPVRLSK